MKLQKKRKFSGGGAPVKKNFLRGSAFLAFFLLLALLMPTAALVADNAPCEHSSWTAWADANSLPDAAGNYYLTADVTLSSSWQPADGTSLCLNGHDVTLGASSGAVSQFSDVGSGQYYTSAVVWAETAVQWAVGVGIVEGDNGFMKPAGNATRAEIATMIMRYCRDIAK